MASTATDVLSAATKRRINPILELEPWGLTLFMRSMTEREKAEYEFSLIDADTGKVLQGKLKQARAALIAKTVCDESGSLIFNEEQVKQLMSRDGKLVGVINRQCRKHVGLDKDEKKEEDCDSTIDDESP
jgi:hypothetical protein